MFTYLNYRARVKGGGLDGGGLKIVHASPTIIFTGIDIFSHAILISIRLFNLFQFHILVKHDGVIMQPFISSVCQLLILKRCIWIRNSSMILHTEDQYFPELLLWDLRAQTGLNKWLHNIHSMMSQCKFTESKNNGHNPNLILIVQTNLSSQSMMKTFSETRQKKINK